MATVLDVLTRVGVTQDLKHYGVPGMKWGVRKRRSSGSSSSSGPTRVKLQDVPQKKGRFGGAAKPGHVKTSGGTNQPSHRDARIAAVAAQKAKASGTHTLSDKELKALLNRLDMEQRYRKLNPTKKNAARAFVEKQLKEIGTKELEKIAKGDVTRIEQIGAIFAGRGVKGRHRK